MSKINSQTQWSYDLLNIIGQGTSSCVYKAIRKCHGITFEQEVAVKILYSENQVELLKDEVNKLLNIRSAKTVSIYGWDYIDGRPAIVMEYINGVTLSDLHTQSWLDTEEILEVCNQLTIALKEINEFGVNHGDLNLSNIMIDTQGHIRILDFGFQTSKGICVTTEFACPSLLQGQKPTLDSDIYSVRKIQQYLLKKINKNDLKIERFGTHKDVVEVIQGLCEKVNFLMEEKHQTLASTQILPSRKLSKTTIPIVRYIAFFLLFMLTVGEVPQSRAQEFIFLEVKTLKWVQVRLPNKITIYSPFKIVLPRHDTIELQWKSQNGSGALHFSPSAGEKIVLKDDSFR